MNDFDIQMGRVIRNGVLAALGVLLLSMTTCYTATKHYDYLDRRMDQTSYLATHFGWHSW